jgi:hypothetical protein
MDRIGIPHRKSLCGIFDEKKQYKEKIKKSNLWNFPVFMQIGYYS